MKTEKGNLWIVFLYKDGIEMKNHIRLVDEILRELSGKFRTI